MLNNNKKDLVDIALKEMTKYIEASNLTAMNNSEKIHHLI